MLAGGRAASLGALVVMLQTETDFGARVGFLLAWGILNFLWIALLRQVRHCRARCR